MTIPNRGEQRFMKEALSLALENVRSDRGGPFGAVVVKDGEVIARGTNLVTSVNDPTAHAEIVAIRNACNLLGTFQLSGCEIYTSCEPCPMCLGAIYWARPDCVFFANSRDDAAAIGFDDRFIYEEIAQDGEKRAIPLLRMDLEGRLESFKAWGKKAGKKSY